MSSRTTASRSSTSKASNSKTDFNNTATREQSRRDSIVRSLDGCVTCRVRRKKCSGADPKDAKGRCPECKRLHVDCLGFPGHIPQWAQRDSDRVKQCAMRLKQWTYQSSSRADPDEDLNLGMYRDPDLSANLNDWEKMKLEEDELRWATRSARRPSATTSKSASRRAEYSGPSYAPTTRRGSAVAPSQGRTVSLQSTDVKTSSRPKEAIHKSTQEKVGAGFMGIYYGGADARASAQASIEEESAAARAPGQFSPSRQSRARGVQSAPLFTVFSSQPSPAKEVQPSVVARGVPAPAHHTYASTNSLAPAVHGMHPIRPPTSYNLAPPTPKHQSGSSRGSSPYYSSASSLSQLSPPPIINSSRPSPALSIAPLPSHPPPQMEFDSQYSLQFDRYSPTYPGLGHGVAPMYDSAYPCNAPSYDPFSAPGYYGTSSSPLVVPQIFAPALDAGYIPYVQGPQTYLY